jgi:hypothetical protein
MTAPPQFADTLRELAHVKAIFQLRTIATVIGAPINNSAAQAPDRPAETALIVPFHNSEVAQP